jgi:PAS domain S-box-containing protein
MRSQDPAPRRRPPVIHGIAFDITELKRTEEALQEERNVASAILDSVGTLVVVLDPRMRIVRFNRVSEETTGYSFAEVRSRFIWDLMTLPDQVERFRNAFEEVQNGGSVQKFEVAWESRWGGRRMIYDYPQIASESAGALFDGTEIDKILSLRILTLIDEEKREMRETDPQARSLLDRTEALDAEQWLRLHGVMRDPHGPEKVG